MKNRALVLILLAYCLSLSGCAKDGTKAIVKAQANMAAWESYGFSMQTMADVNIADFGHMKLVSVSDGINQIKPSFIMEMDSQIIMQSNENDPQTVSLKQYALEGDGAISLFHNSQGNWQKSVITGEGPVAAITKQPSDTLAVYLKSMKSATVSGSEKINGIPCNKVTAMLSYEAMGEILNSFEFASDLGISEDVVLSLDDNDDGIETIFWIGKSDGMIYKQELDISRLIKKLLSQGFAKEQQGYRDVSQVIMNMNVVYFDINNIEPIVIPPAVEALF